MRAVLLIGCVCATIASGVARADARALTSVEAFHEACEDVRARVHPVLYTVSIDAGWRFGRHRDGLLFVDTRRNLNALEGHVSLLLSGLEPITFEADEERAGALREAARGGATLRVGFFLGFDDSRRQPCVLRNAHAVTIVRADLAYAELVRDGESATVIARAESDRLRAWNDDREALTIPGTGPRGVVGEGRFANGDTAPAAWQRALTSAGSRSAFARCHEAGVARGASVEGQVVVRLNVETRTGRIRRADVALSSIGDAEEAECIATALGNHVTLSPGPAAWPAEVVDLSVPVRLAAD